jgi:hypothetical protein
MGIWRKRKKEEGDKMEREDTGKLINVRLSKKTGEPILGFSSQRGEDQARRLRIQAEELRNMARKLERLADEMEKSSPGGKAVRFVRKVLRKGALDGPGNGG